MIAGKYFTLEELTDSPTAKRLGIDNTPTSEVLKNLQHLVAHILDPAREAIGVPIRITSGYRSWQLNGAVGGSKTSQHARGEAVDMVCADNRRLFEYIRQHLTFDQLIWELGDGTAPAWVHVSYTADRANRRQVLRAIKRGGKTIYKNI